MSQTTNMLLDLPEPEVTKGPEYATKEVGALQEIDSHSHRTRKGVKVPSAGISINADLGIQRKNILALRSARLSNSGAVLSLSDDLSCLAVVSGNLYFNDAAGNRIKLTNGAAIYAPSVGGIGGNYGTGAESVYYSSAANKFYFTRAADTAGVMDCGALTIRAAGVAANGVTLTAPAGLAASYTLKLFTALPAAIKIVTLTSAGQLTSVYDLDSSSIEAASNVIQVKDLGVATAKFAAASIPYAKFAAANVVVGTPVSSYTNATTTYTLVCSVTITTSGKNVRIFAQPSGTTGSFLGAYGPFGNNRPKWQVQRDGVAITSSMIVDGSTTNDTTLRGMGVDVDVLDVAPAAGAHTYGLYMRAETATVTAGAVDVALVAMELGS